MRVEVLRGATALGVCADPAFREAWSRLARQTPWNTAFQSPGFCVSWYRAYGHRFEPLLLVRREGGTLRGLMPLAVAPNGRLMHAGDHQCEYQGWLAHRADGGFGAAATEAAFAATGATTWTWRHTAPGLPIGEIEEAAGLSGLTRTTHRCPLLDVADADFLESRERGRLRTHRNHFARLGLRYERVTEPEAARTVLDRLALWCDLRQGAAHDVLPFSTDPDKLGFHRELLAPDSGFWLSALWVDDGLLAAHLGPCDGVELALGVQAYDPRHARRSPGAILVLELAADLAAAGGRTLDLTPGGDSWKERWASHHRDVHGLVLHRGRIAAAVASAGRKLEKGARGVLRGLGAEPARLRERLSVVTGGAGEAIPAPVLCAATCPAPATSAATELGASTLDRLLVEGGARLPDPAALLGPASRFLGEGWRAWGHERGAEARPAVIAWTPPEEGWIDLTDPAAPRCRRDERDPGCPTVPDASLLVVLSTLAPDPVSDAALDLPAAVAAALGHTGSLTLLVDAGLARSAGARFRRLDRERRAG